MAVNTCGNPRWREPLPCSSWGQLSHVLTPDNFRLSLGQKEGWISSRVRYATAAVEGSSSPVINTVGKANLMPLASNAFLIIAKALRRMTNCSPGRVALLDGADW